MATAQKKGAKKKFFEIEAPITATKIHLLAFEPKDLDGRAVKIDMTKSLRGKSFELKLKVTSNGDSLTADPVSLQLFQSYVRKTIRKGTDYIEDSFEAECKDALLRIKPFMITRKRVSRSIRNALRENARKFLEGHLKVRNSKDIFTEVTTNKLQKQLSIKLKKIYPLALCEIRGVITVKKLESTKKDKKAKDEPETPEISQ